MTSKAEWLALAERCEKATGSDRDIERCMGSLLPEGFQMIPYFGFTGSLDAITSLIERELPEMRWLCRPDKEGGFGTLYAAPEAIEQGSLKTWKTIKQESLKEWPCWAYADTPALALCAAFCRAMAEKVTA